MNYEEMSLAELKALAKEKGLKKTSLLKKSELCELLKNADGNDLTGDAAENTRKDTIEKVSEVVTEDIEKKGAESDAENVSEAAENVTENKASVSREREILRREPADNGRNGYQRNYQNNQNYGQSQGNQNYGTQNYGAQNTRNTQNYRENGNFRPQYQQQNPGYQQQNPGYQQQTTGYQQQNQNYQAPQQSSQSSLDSGIEKNGILEIMPEGFGFIRCDNYLPGANDVYVSPMQIRRYGLRSGDIIKGNTKVQTATEKFSALLYVKSVNGYTVDETLRRKKFETLTPIFPHERIHLERPGCSVAARMVDLIAPIGKGQRGMIVSQPKSGKTTLLKEIANSITQNHPDMNVIILLIDERPEEVTDIKESIHGDKVEVIYSTFDELPENHKRVSEMVIDRAKRLVEYGNDVVILLDSITRLARAYNLTCISSGRTLSGGLDPAALHMPKKFFGAARTMREGGSLTILATALVDTGSRMDDVVFEEFKGTGNMELVLDRNLSERRIFPAIDLAKSGTRRDDLLLTPDEYDAMARVRKALSGSRAEDTTEKLINMCAHTKNNREFVNCIKKGI